MVLDVSRLQTLCGDSFDCYLFMRPWGLLLLLLLVLFTLEVVSFCHVSLVQLSFLQNSNS